MRDLHAARYISLVTIRRSGIEVRTPVWFASSGENQLYSFSAKSAGKVKRLKHTKEVKIATCDARGGHCGDWFDASAEIITDPKESREAYGLLQRKYGLQMAVTNFFSRLTGKINNRVVIRINLEVQK
jgi:PPOX class probable F420-dependent enzyme